MNGVILPSFPILQIDVIDSADWFKDFKYKLESKEGIPRAFGFLLESWENPISPVIDPDEEFFKKIKDEPCPF
jgi:hypothetical protein